MPSYNMRLMQAEQSGYHSIKRCKFGDGFMLMAVSLRALPASISKTLAETFDDSAITIRQTK